MPSDESGVDISRWKPEDAKMKETPTYSQAREIAGHLERTGDVLSLTRIGANPLLRYTPYRNNRGTKVGMWSCISYYFEAMPEATLLNSPHIVRPWEKDDWEINIITTPWVVHQLAKTPWAKLEVNPVEDSPFGGRMLEWETTEYEVPQES